MRMAGLAPLGLMLALAGYPDPIPESGDPLGSFPLRKSTQTPLARIVHLYKDSSLVKIVFPDGTDYTGTIEEPVVISAESEKR